MNFIKSSEYSSKEREERVDADKKLLSFGVTYLDESMRGISPHDLVLIGAPSGAGKTALCCRIAAANIEKGKRVHCFALEEEMYGYERRIKWEIFAKYFFSANKRPVPSINFQDWSLGRYLESCKDIEDKAHEEFISKFSTLYTFYKQGKFDVHDLILNVTTIADESDLIIVDHVHYFDYDGDKESSAIKDIAMTARTLALEQGIPIILISHLRKRDKFSTEICAGMEEFHGTSDLYKIASKAITIGPGNLIDPGRFETFFRVVKYRNDGGLTRYMAKTMYNQNLGKYEDGYEIGAANQSRDAGFVKLDRHLLPDWCLRATGYSNGSRNLAEGKPSPARLTNWQRTFEARDEED